ncbi:MAG TPA: rhomboid family intramembrane serine protease [Haliangiales bacterium]|nr:rhomboid family intramembrane serine protease [Haliangiales bacterium]
MTSAESTDTIIPARHRQQAMDWSLVLLSQGIESVIEQSESGWVLLVGREVHTRALGILRQYQLENRGWSWRQRMPWPEITFHWGAIGWCLLLALFHWSSHVWGSHLESAGVMNPTAVHNGSWWRLFTATMLHFDLAHLMANLAIGFPVLGLAMGRYGPACALLAAYLAGVGGNIAGLFLHTDLRPGLGASGMVMGGFGLLTIQSLSLRLKNPKSWKYIIAGVLGGIMLFTLFGLNPASDVVAHLGGFICGLILGAVMALIPQKKLLSPSANTLCGAVLAGLIALTWVLALRHVLPSP